MASKRVVGVGNAALDFFGVVEKFPTPEVAAQLTQFSLQGGGHVATALVTAASLGLETVFCGKISNDIFGTYIRLGLEEGGLGLNGLIVEPDRVSPFSFIALEAPTDRRTVCSTPGSCSALGVDEVDLGLLDGAAALLVDGHHIEAAVKAAEHAHAVGIPVFLDASSLKEGMGELVPLVHVLVAAERFSAEVAPQGELHDSLRELKRMGPETVVITLGSDGSIGLQGDRVVRQKALSVDVADTSGAGDVYFGALVFAWLQRWPLEKVMQFATAAAGLKCRYLGGRAGVPSLAEVEKHAFGGSGG